VVRRETHLSSLVGAMGGSLDRPITAKESDCAAPSGSLRLAWGSSCMQGWRTGMEDAHICLPSLAKDGLWKDVAMFGVMDGHGGEQVAKFAERHLPMELCAYGPLNGSLTFKDLKPGLTRAFHRIDERLREAKCLPELRELSNSPSPEAMGGGGRTAVAGKSVDPDHVGCTCVIACITADEIVVANAGDSRAVLCRGGKAVGLSEDHKPNDPGEERRIVAAGGRIEKQNGVGKPCYRVNGNLNLSRALGDLEYKKDRALGPEAQIISGTPDVERFQRTPDDEFMVICCDGIWDIKENQEVVDFVRARLRAPKGGHADPQDMARVMEELMDDCMSPDLRRTKGLGGDNMTALVVWLKDTLGKPQPAPASAVASTPSRARLLRTQVARSSSEVFVWLELPESVRSSPPEDIQLWVHHRASELEVSVLPSKVVGGVGPSPAMAETRFKLGAHLPSGVGLQAIRTDQAQLAAKFYRKSNKMRIRLPCQPVK